MAGRAGDRSVASIIGVLLLVAVAIVAAMLTVVLALTILPQDEPSTAYTASFQIDRSNGEVVIRPSHVQPGNRYQLSVNGAEIYEWTDNQAQPVTCLNAGDELRIVAEEADTDDSYLVREHDVAAPTRCSLAGGASRFAFAVVGNRQMPLLDEAYDFSLAIDPDGPTSQLGSEDFPTTNPWVYVQRYDTQIEGLGPPVYVVVFPDNVHNSGYDWDDDPPAAVREAMPNAYSIQGGNVVVNGSAVEPTNDVYMVFAPGCTESTFVFVRMSGGYNNQILLDGQEMFRTSSTTSGTVYTRRGVDCVD
jgi:flagellin-like protein